MRNRNRSRRPTVVTRQPTLVEKILEFVTFGLWKPNLVVRSGAAGASASVRADLERRPGREREESPKDAQLTQRTRREGDGERERNRDRDGERDAERDRGREKRPPEPSEVTTERLYVGNLDYETTEADLYDLFNGVGKVKDAEVVCHKYTQRSKGYAFVVMTSVDEARRAVEVLNNKQFMGRELWVSGAKSAGPRDLEDGSADEELPTPADPAPEQPEAAEEIPGRQAVA